MTTSTVAQYSIGRLFDSFLGEEPVKWFGIQTVGTIGGILAPFTSVLGNIVYAHTVNCTYNPDSGHYQKYTGSWFIFGESISLSILSLPATATAGIFKATSPGFIGPNPTALQGGYFQVGYTFDTLLGITGSRFIMGYGHGGAFLPPGIAFGVKPFGFGLTTGLSISLPGGQYMDCNPPPIP